MRKRICYVIEEELAEAVWLYARRRGKKPRDIVEEALRRFLQQPAKEQRPVEAQRPLEPAAQPALEKQPAAEKPPSWILQNNWVSVLRGRVDK